MPALGFSVGLIDTYHTLCIGRSSSSVSNRTQVPYFRYFGPTAIVPGFKQMVSLLRIVLESVPDLLTLWVRLWRSVVLVEATVHHQQVGNPVS